jgi:hypothetical protein
LKHVSNHSATQYQLKISGLFPPAITGQDDNMCCMIPCVNTTMSSFCLERVKMYTSLILFDNLDSKTLKQKVKLSLKNIGPSS